jgi:hypothetical protein
MTLTRRAAPWLLSLALSPLADAQTAKLHYVQEFAFSSETLAQDVVAVHFPDWTLGTLVDATFTLSFTEIEWSLETCCTSSSPSQQLPSTFLFTVVPSMYAIGTSGSLIVALQTLQPEDSPLFSTLESFDPFECKEVSSASMATWTLDPVTLPMTGLNAVHLAALLDPANPQSIIVSGAPGAAYVFNSGIFGWLDEVAPATWASNATLGVQYTVEPVSASNWSPPPWWTNLGQALPGTHGAPSLIGAGELESDTPFDLILHGARESSVGFLMAGIEEFNAPFKGGILVPNPSGSGFALPFTTDATGALSLQTAWPADVPGGSSLILQCWVVDPNGPKGAAATNAVAVLTPP